MPEKLGMAVSAVGGAGRSSLQGQCEFHDIVVGSKWKHRYGLTQDANKIV